MWKKILIIFGAHLPAQQLPACSNSCWCCYCQYHGQQSTIKSNNQQSTCAWEKRVNKKGWGGRGKRNKQQQAVCICGANTMPMSTQCPHQHNAHTNTMPPMTLPTHWWHWERQKEYVRELFNIFDAHLLAQWLPLLWPPALWEVEMPPINAKCNNQPGAKRKPIKRAWGRGMIKR